MWPNTEWISFDDESSSDIRQISAEAEIIPIPDEKQALINGILEEHPDMLPMAHYRLDGTEKRCCPQPYCENPASHIYAHSGVKRKKILAMANGQPATVELSYRKLRCPKCGTVFYSQDGFDTEKTYTPGFRNYLSSLTAMDPTITSKQIQTVYGVIPSMQTNICKEQCELNQSMIVSVAECREIYVCPFDYKEERRCAILGVDNDGHGLLLTILASYDAASINAFLKAKTTNKDNVETAYCSFDKDIADCLYDVFPHAEIKFYKEAVEETLALMRRDWQPYERRTVENEVLKFWRMILLERKPFELNVQAWKDSLTDEQQNLLAPLLESLHSIWKVWGHSVPMSKSNKIYAQIKYRIDIYRSMNYGFERMVDMLMFRDCPLVGTFSGENKVIAGGQTFTDTRNVMPGWHDYGAIIA